jgi:hypothetical protein
MDDKQPGDILDRKLVAESEEGQAEWLLKVEDDGTTVWHPYYFDNEGEVIYEPMWMPLPGSQFLFLECPVFEALYEGTRGPGKTLTLLMDFAREIGKGYGSAWRGILFRRQFGDLDDVVRKIEEWFPVLFPGFRFLKSKSEYMAIWPTGEALLLRHLDKPEDYDEYHGHEYPWIGFEELTQWEDDVAYKLMFSCCRPPRQGIPSRIRSTTNPYGVGHNWVKRRFKLPYHRGKVINIPGEMPRVAIHGTLAENFLLLHAQPDYPTIIHNAARNKAQAKAWIEGDWEVTAGGMFDDIWNSHLHIIPNFNLGDVPRGWTLTRAYDHGQSHPFSVGWFLESNGEPLTLSDGRVVGNVRGDLIMWMEWYGTTGNTNEGIRMPAKKIAQGIIDRETDEGAGTFLKVTPGPADTEIFNRLSDRQNKSPADDMEDEGVFWERADKSAGSRHRGWEIVREYLHGALPNPDGSREQPGLFICQRCKWWIELVPPSPRSDDDPDDIPKKSEDHAADMTRYRCSWDIPGMFRRSF